MIAEGELQRTRNERDEATSLCDKVLSHTQIISRATKALDLIRAKRPAPNWENRLKHYLALIDLQKDRDAALAEKDAALAAMEAKYIALQKVNDAVLSEKDQQIAALQAALAKMKSDPEIAALHDQQVQGSKKMPQTRYEQILNEKRQELERLDASIQLTRRRLLEL